MYKAIERGEQKLQKFADNQNAIASKLAKYKDPWREVKVRTSVGQLWARSWGILTVSKVWEGCRKAAWV